MISEPSLRCVNVIRVDTIQVRLIPRIKRSVLYISGVKLNFLIKNVNLQADDYYHDLENLDANDTGIELSTSSIVEGDSTDVSLSESIAYDTCSLSGATTTGGSAFSSQHTSPEMRSASTLPSKLQAKPLEWDEMDELLQIERRVDETTGKMYQTMPSALSSSQCSNTVSSSTTSTTDDSSHTLVDDFKSLDMISSATTTSGTDEFATPQSTLHDGDFERFSQQINEEFINSSNQMQTINDGTLKAKQPIDMSRINDSLKLYSENVMSKSFGGTTFDDQSLRKPQIQYQTLKAEGGAGVELRSAARNYLLQKSGSSPMQSYGAQQQEWRDRAVNRSKSGPNWFDGCSDDGSDNCETLKPSTIRRNLEKYNIRMDCYEDAAAAAAAMAANVEAASGLLSVSTENAEALTPTTESIPTMTASNDDTTECTATSACHRPSCSNCCNGRGGDDSVVLRRPKTGSTAIKRRSGNKRYLLLTFHTLNNNFFTLILRVADLVQN